MMNVQPKFDGLHGPRPLEGAPGQGASRRCPASSRIAVKAAPSASAMGPDVFAVDCSVVTPSICPRAPRSVLIEATFKIDLQ